MPQFNSFPKLPSGDPVLGMNGLLDLLRQFPPEGMPFKTFRSALKRLGVWNRERLTDLLNFLRVPHSDPVMPSTFMTELAQAEDDEAAMQRFGLRLWTVNPLLFATVIGRLNERVHSPIELLKYVDSFAYEGARITGPELQNWVRLCQGMRLFKPVGTRLGLDSAAAAFIDLARDFEVEEFLEEDRPEPALFPTEPVTQAPVAQAPIAQAPVAQSPIAQPPVAQAPITQSPAAQVRTEPAAVAPSGPAALADPRIYGSAGGAQGLRAAQSAPPAENREANAEALAAWWAKVGPENTPPPNIDDYGVGTADWRDDPDRALLHAAVAAALHFKLGERAGPPAFVALKQTGALDALHDGVLPDGAVDTIDPRALMLASVIARRCAENPDLANDLERAKTGAEAFALLEMALGRGLLGLELFWLCRALARMGAVRAPGYRALTAVPTRAARDVLFRLGFLDTPYAASTEALVAAAAAARRGIPDADAADQVLTLFAISAGCEYGCRQTAGCAFVCHERAEQG